MSTNSLEARIAALEQIIAGMGDQGESLQPNYLTINPTTGIVSANFNGVVTGSLQIPENQSGTVPVTPQNSIVWVDPGNTSREAISGGVTPTPGQHDLALLSDASGLGSLSNSALLELISSAGGGSPGNPGSQVLATVRDSGFLPNIHHANILDSSGNSDFSYRYKVVGTTGTPAPWNLVETNASGTITLPSGSNVFMGDRVGILVYSQSAVVTVAAPAGMNVWADGGGFSTHQLVGVTFREYIFDGGGAWIAAGTVSIPGILFPGFVDNPTGALVAGGNTVTWSSGSASAYVSPTGSPFQGLLVNQAGNYIITAQARFDTTAGGNRYIAITVGGVIIDDYQAGCAQNSIGVGLTSSLTIAINVGNAIGLNAFTDVATGPLTHSRLSAMLIR